MCVVLLLEWTVHKGGFPILADKVNVLEPLQKIKDTGTQTYLILGCGSIGLATAKGLKEHEYNVLIVDINEKVVESLREQNMDAFLGDIGDPTFLSDILRSTQFNAVLVLGDDPVSNQRALATIKEVSPETYVIVRAVDPIEQETLKEKGADTVILPAEVVAKTIIRMVEGVTLSKRTDKLLKLLGEMRNGKLGIILHDSPDPDAIASGLALKYIADSVGTKADILYQGQVGHQVNRAFVNLLDIEMKRIEEVNLDEYTGFALIDTAPGGNNALPEGIEPDIIIDHHPPVRTDLSSYYIDIRPGTGACSTILTKYIQQLGLPIEKELATALLHGIRTDTQGFKRNTSPADLTAAAFLYPLVDHTLLSQIETPPMSTETLDVLGEAIRNRMIKGSYLISNVGFIRDRDALVQAADYLLNLEGISTVIVFGLDEKKIHIVGRNKDVRVNIGAVLQEAFGDIGTAGGHSTAGAAQVPLGVFSGMKDKESLLKLVGDAVSTRFFSKIGIENDEKIT
ncbi:MAG: potassium transporter TrkA [Candidatus Syntrophoarchaeum sp. WYZ-LMO15]|nr:MAG: potassium transporter TrkA [Candidatus Syntrophoarchaeum sp. WYZ-LMO15]